jgi:hypothetical protein
MFRRISILGPLWSTIQHQAVLGIIVVCQNLLGLQNLSLPPGSLAKIIG